MSLADSHSVGREPPVQRVSTFELFFDLVFVFTLTQLTNLLAYPKDASDYLKTLLVFMTLMWIYEGYAWLTSNVVISGAEGATKRYFLFLGMAGFFVMALSIPDIFGAGALPYALGLLVATTVHAGLFMTAQTSGSRAILQVAPFNFASVVLVTVAAFVPMPWVWVAWVGAVGVLLAATLLRTESGFQVSPSHFVERNGLLIIVALGESIVDVGVGAGGQPINTILIISVVLAVFLIGSVWRTYFDSDDTVAEHTFSAAGPDEQGRMALLGFGYAHFVMILGIILGAAGLKVAIAHPTDNPAAIGIWNLAAGFALYLVGDVLYRYILHIGAGYARLLVAALLLATVPLGLFSGALAQLVVGVLLFQLLWPIESRLKVGQKSVDRS